MGCDATGRRQGSVSGQGGSGDCRRSAQQFQDDGPVTSRTLGDHVHRQRRRAAFRRLPHWESRWTGRGASAGLCLPLCYRLDWLRSGCVLDGWLCQSRPALGVLGPRFAAGLRVSRMWHSSPKNGASSTAAHPAPAHSRPGVAGLCGLSAFTVISARALHEGPRGNGRDRFVP